MKLLFETDAFAELLSAFIQKGGWLSASLGGAALLYFFQDKLVFNPVRGSTAVYGCPANHRIRAVVLEMRDGARLRGWWMRANRETPTNCPAIIYFGGRSEEVSWVSKQLGSFSGHHSLFVNYRGYGDSEGKPSERDLLSDALELYDWMADQPGVDPKKIVVIGRSLGAGVAAYVAAHRPAAAAVLITPYDSFVEIARRRFPHCGTQLFLKHRFEAMQFALEASTPALMLLADTDDIVPKEHAARLIDAWVGPKKVVTIDQTTHLDIQSHPETWNAIREFVHNAVVRGERRRTGRPTHLGTETAAQSL